MTADALAAAEDAAVTADLEDIAKTLRALSGRAEQRLKDCPVCGETFEATRSDAKTCSPACRQNAYRRRVAHAPRIRNAETDAGVAPNTRNADGQRGVHLVNVTDDAGGAAPRHRDIRNTHGSHDAVAGGAS